MSKLHTAAFFPERGWTPVEFQSLTASKLITCYAQEHGFALVRTVADETELLTLAVDPAYRRQGIADSLMREWLKKTSARHAFLEVASDNAAAQALYTKYGFAEAGRRAGYYRRANAPAVDAVLMQAAVTHRKTPESPSHVPKTG